MVKREGVMVELGVSTSKAVAELAAALTKTGTTPMSRTCN